jgi:hypothetical protein
VLPNAVSRVMMSQDGLARFGNDHLDAISELGKYGDRGGDFHV